jgi:hypothetical protein
MKYTTEADVENYLLLDIDDNFSANIERWIESMSRHMDRKCNRTLVQGTSEEILLDGNGRTELPIPECASITTVEVDEVDITSSVKAYPTTQASKNKLKLESDYFTKGLQNVAINGKFGLHSASDEDDVDSVPEDIRFACTVLVAGIVNNSNNNRDAVKSEKVGQYSVTYNDPMQRKDYQIALSTLKQYRRIAI